MAACRAASLAAEELNYSPLKKEQVMAIQEFLNGSDVFCHFTYGVWEDCLLCLPPKGI